MKFLKYHFASFIVCSLLFSCSTFYQPQSVKYKDYRFTNASKPDSAILQLLKPYADSVNKSMNDIVAINEAELEKKIAHEESKKPPEQRRLPEYGSDKDFQLMQALNQLKGKPVLVSKTLTERKEEKKE